VCAKCRTHLNLMILYPKNPALSPCPNAENPLHHFVRAEWMETGEKQDWETVMLGSPADITVFQCSNGHCAAKLLVRYTPPVLKQEIVDILLDRDFLAKRYDAAFKVNEAVWNGMAAPAIIDVLWDLRIYLINARNKDSEKRHIMMSNKRFQTRFGIYGDPMKQVLEELRFRRDEANQRWHVPEPRVADQIPLVDPFDIFEDDAEHEVLALIANRPQEELQKFPSWKEQLPASAVREMQRITSAQSYDTTLFSRTNKSDPSQRPAAYVGLGISPDAADSLLIYAYRRQISTDASNVPFYYEFLRDVALERRSEALQTEVGVEESLGRFSAKALEEAYSSFGLSRKAYLDDDHIIGIFTSRLMDMPVQETELRNSLRIIGAWRKSPRIQAVADNGQSDSRARQLIILTEPVIKTYQQALQCLEAEESTTDDSIQALYTVKVG
jgi:ubiquitin carboxyl-terminal hydrolase 25